MIKKNVYVFKSVQVLCFPSSSAHAHTYTNIHTTQAHTSVFSEKFTEALRIERYCLIYFQKLGRFYFLGIIYITTHTRARTHTGQNI